MADRKITDLTALTTPASADVLPIVDVSEAAAADKNKKITVGELFKGVPDGSAAAPAIAFETDDGNGLFLSTTDTIGIATNGVSRATVSTTAVTSTLPVIVPDGSAAAPSVAFTGSGTDTGFYSAGANQVSITTNGVQRIGIQGDGDINIDNGGLFYNATSNLLGIGTATPGSFDAGANNLVVGSGSGEEGLTIYTGNTSRGIINFADGTAGVETYVGQVAYDHNANAMTFVTSAAERARIDSSGRLLVGTSSAAGGEVLQANGEYPACFVRASTSGGPIVNFKRNRGTSPSDYTAIQNNDNIGTLQWAGAYGSEYAAGASIAAFADGQTWASGDCPGRLVFSTTADGASSPTTRMTIKNGGEVCIGTTDVHVANRNALENATTGQLTFRHSGTTAGRYNIVGMNSGSAFIVSDSSGGTGVQLAYSGTSWSTLSDERFKTDLEPIESGLNKVAALRALTGRLVTDPEEKRRSFLIAQDVDAVLPEAVDKTDPEALALSYTEVVPLLVAALKESKERIEILEAKVAALESA